MSEPDVCGSPEKNADLVASYLIRMGVPLEKKEGGEWSGLHRAGRAEIVFRLNDDHDDYGGLRFDRVAETNEPVVMVEMESPASDWRVAYIPAGVSHIPSPRSTRFPLYMERVLASEEYALPAADRAGRILDRMLDRVAKVITPWTRLVGVELIYGLIGVYAQDYCQTLCLSGARHASIREAVLARAGVL